MTTLELLKYYSNLLILQYKNKPKATATIEAAVSGVIIPQVSVQQISFSDVSTSGSFILSYNGVNSVSINWNDATPTIQSDLQAISGLSAVTVAGSIPSQILKVTFTGVIPPALSLVLVSSSLQASGSSVTIAIQETDLTLPLAVQGAYNLTVQPHAVGVQLDVLGKYAGVIRTGTGFNGQVITLDDADFLTFIKMAIITNTSGSSLYDIDSLIFQFFAGAILVFDYADMRMTYLVSSTIGSTDLLELFITENLLPRPMGVQISVVLAPVINSFFGFITYNNPVQPSITRPFNNYTNYQTDWPFMSYVYAFLP